MDLAPGQSVHELRELVVRQPTSPVRRVVVGVDGSAAAAAAVQWAAAEACRHEVALRIVSAWDEPTVASDGADPARVAATQVHKALTRVLGWPHYPPRIACVTPRGRPGPALLNEAGPADLLVLGLTGQPGADLPGRVNRYCRQQGTSPLVFVTAVQSLLSRPAPHVVPPPLLAVISQQRPARR